LAHRRAARRRRSPSANYTWLWPSCRTLSTASSLPASWSGWRLAPHNPCRY